MFDWIIIAFLISTLFIGIIAIFSESLEIFTTNKTSRKAKKSILIIIISVITIIISFNLLMMLR